MRSMMAGLMVAVGSANLCVASEDLTGTLVVLNKAEASASLVDCATGREIKRLPTGAGPHEVAVSPDGATAVVADYGTREPGHTLTVIDLARQEVRRTIDLKEHHRPHGIQFLPGGKRVVVTAEHEQFVLVVEIATGTIEHAIPTGQRVSHMLAITPDAKRVFVANIGSGNVSVINLDSAAAIATVPAGRGAEGIDISPDGREVWVSNRGQDTLSVIDAAALQVVATLPCASFPIRVKFTPDGVHVLVSNARSGDVAVFDAAQRKEIRRIGMGETAADDREDRLFRDRFGKSPVPVGILIAPGGELAFVANTNADVVSVIDLADWTITRRLTAGREPDGLAYSPLVLGAPTQE